MRVLVLEGDASLGGVLTDLLADQGHPADGARTMANRLARPRGAVGRLRCGRVLAGGGRRVARLDPVRAADLEVAAVVPEPFDLDGFLGALAAVASPPPARPTRRRVGRRRCGRRSR
jgi:hypothetical protein